MDGFFFFFFFTLTFLPVSWNANTLSGDQSKALKQHSTINKIVETDKKQNKIKTRFSPPPKPDQSAFSSYTPHAHKQS